jgi:hypothetical protein
MPPGSPCTAFDSTVSIRLHTGGKKKPQRRSNGVRKMADLKVRTTLAERASVFQSGCSAGLQACSHGGRGAFSDCA